MLNITTCILTAVLTAGATPSEPRPSVTPASPGVNQALITHCQVFLIDDVHVPANATGALVTLSVRDGEPVRQGQLLAQTDDRQAQFDKLAAELKRDAASAKAQDDIEIRHSEASFGVADAELSQSEEINRRSPGTVSAAELRRLQLTRRRAELQIDRSRLELKIAGMTADVETTMVAAAEDNIRRCQITAPFDGIVLDILRHEAEWVNAGEPVLRMIRLDRLRVEGFLNLSQFNLEDVDGRRVSVEIERAHGEKIRLAGQVVFVSPLVQAGDKYRVRAEVENRVHNGHWLLGPGMAASMTIHLQPAATQATAHSDRQTNRR